MQDSGNTFRRINELVIALKNRGCRLAGTNRIKPELWQAAVSSHDHWLDRLFDLAARIVIGTRPVIKNKNRLNQGYIWQSEVG